MSLDALQKHELKRFIKELENFRGRHTELVSVLIPAGYDINAIIGHLSQEQGTATNIKSASTRKNVIDALEKMIQHLRLYKQTPPNGLACFSGNVSEREGQFDFKVWSIEPPIPLNTRLYRCDKEFQLDLLRDMLDDKEIYGLVVMDRRDGNVAMLKGKSIINISKASSNVPGKTRAGGQSAMRYHRLREGAAKEFYTKIGMMVKDAFFDKRDQLKGIIIGGPGPTKYDFIEGNYVPNELKQKVIGIKDLSYTEEFGVQELVDKAQDILANEEVGKEKEAMGKFFHILATKPNMVSYGESQVMSLVQRGTVDLLLISEDLEEEKIEAFEKEAEKFGTTIMIISTETREGVQLRDIGKVGAILRYEIDT
ncbi:peptide chain release factor aRF-1 [Candidatus Woesearchaeota archaeon]|nr:MAG: peptide chain release factor subunit 1 [archaeon GW2011_AR4]MBS3129583.1 peptide chain release factor aRF-1 [Candidatus Woesearchaeota archaeon]HIH37551.1 peptide chain release factor 1 [Candidatus Woesearchaeota archaeon]HIH49700.1 peptide chain release factor 1 [Candidatus Woesearchaeota archaeon]HIJ03194.1 peptide chain release factor 1 [Candidatus Woesearchaeota archaeon]